MGTDDARKPTVFVYPGGESALDKSGIGTARRNHVLMAGREGWSISRSNHEPFDVLHVDSWQLGAARQVRLATARGAAIVISVHNTKHDFVDSLVGTRLFAPLFERWVKWLYSHGDVLLAPSEVALRRLRAMGLRNEVRQLSGGFDDEVFRVFGVSRADAFLGTRLAGQIPEHGPVILGVGNTFRRKGFLDFVATARLMPSATFVWCGPIWSVLAGSSVSWTLATKPPNLLLTGHVNAAKLSQIMNASSVYAALSHDETEGLALLEALACGLPTVMRDLDAYQGTLRIEEVARVTVDASPSDVAVAVSRLIQCDVPTAVRRKIGDSVVERSLSRIGPILIDAYWEAVALRHHGATLSK